MDKAYIRELNFDCDTFSDAKESLNTVLQKLLGTMVGCGAKEGSITHEAGRWFPQRDHPEL